MNKFKRGYGFRPSDEELIEHLRNRALSGIGCDYSVQEITDLGVDICNWDPWDLPGLTNMVTSTDRTWYFFYPITYKYPECKRRKINDGKRKPLINRATKNGKWKPSGDPRKVRASDSKELIGLKKSLYFYYTDQVNDHKNRAKLYQNETSNSNNQKTKAKYQNSYQNKTPWVLYVFELLDDDHVIPPTQNKYVLGKLMIQSEPITNKSSSKGQQLPPQVHIDFHDQLDDWVQNQSSISEQPNEFASSSPVDNCTTYPEEIRSNRDNFVNDYQVSQVQLPSNLENYVADDAVLQNLQVEYYATSEVPNINIGAENQLNSNQYDNPYQNLVSFHNNETYPVPSSDSNNHPIAELSHMHLFDLDDSYWNEFMSTV